MTFSFSSYNEFVNEFRRYHFHECTSCNGMRELNEEEVEIIIDDKMMRFDRLMVLTCTNCNSSCLPFYTKQLIDGCYKSMVEGNQVVGLFSQKVYKQEFEYCAEQDFNYDHRDYFNIPGLSCDEEHSVEGFLTPVYFSNKVLLYFLNDPDYKVKLGSETYGYFQFKDEWGIPFGINRNGKVVFWLGDLDCADNHTLSIMKPHNVESDHQLIVSEFYAAQMCCIWSEPNREISICRQKHMLLIAIMKNYNISLFHLDDEIKQHINGYQKPIIINERTIEPTINMLHKVLIEGVDIDSFKQLYLRLYPQPDAKYKEWKSIKFYEALLIKILPPNEDIRTIIAPLYL